MPGRKHTQKDQKEQEFFPLYVHREYFERVTTLADKKGCYIYHVTESLIDAGLPADTAGTVRQAQANSEQ